MSSDKQVLVVDSANGTLEGVMEELDELGFRVIWVPNLATALEFIKASPKLSLIIASAAATKMGGLDFLVQAKEFAPNVRIIWGVLSNQPDKVDSARESRQPDSLIPEPFHRDALRAAISELLAEHFYPPDVAQAIKSAALEVLSPFGTFRVDRGAFLVANQSALAEVSAVIPFFGGVAGHLMLGTTRAHAAALYADMLPKARAARTEQIEDLIGELCNQVLGRVNTFFALRSVAVEHGTPIYIRAAGKTLRYPGRQPSFAVSLIEGETRVHLEYYLSDFDRSKLEAPVATRAIPLGEVRYL